MATTVNEGMNSFSSNQKSPVELKLLGIDKIWVRYSNGQWTEKGKAVDKTNYYSEHLEETAKRPWWKFWG